jgi:hypothetical protein
MPFKGIVDPLVRGEHIIGQGPVQSVGLLCAGAKGAGTGPDKGSHLARMGSASKERGAFASFAFENYEIAAYRSLITMTETVGMPQFRAPLEATLNEEMRMAQWLGDNIQAVTRRYMAEVKAEEVKAKS